MHQTTVSLRNGKGLARHNDRTAGIGDHVDIKSTCNNQYYYKGSWVSDMPYGNLKTYEIDRYKELYGDWLAERNNKYIKARKKDRVKTIEDIYASPRYEPREMILQVGNIDNPPDADKFKDIVKEFLDELQRKYGRNIKLLDAVLHMDEATPHVHIRYTICARQSGVQMPAIDKGLAEAGFQHKTHRNDKPQNSKYNNREIAFTDFLRQRFIDIVRQFMQVDIIQGISPRHHADKGEYIRQRDAAYAAAAAKLDIDRAEVMRKQAKNDIKEHQLREREARISDLETVEAIYNAALDEADYEYQHNRSRGRGR